MDGKKTGQKISWPEDIDVDLLMGKVTNENTHPGIVSLLRGSMKAWTSPLLRRERWLTISDEDFLVMSPAIALASSFMLGGDALQYWHGLFATPTTDSGVHHKQFARVSPKRHAFLSDAEAQRTLDKLQSLARAITIACGEIKERYFAQTYSLRYDFITPGICGCRASITIQRWMVDELDVRSVTADESARPLLRRWLNLAITLMHELAHAVCTASHGFDTEMEFEKDGFVEMGYALEKLIFGGELSLVNKGCKDEQVAIFTVHPGSFACNDSTKATERTAANDRETEPIALVEDTLLEHWFGKLLEAGAGEALCNSLRECAGKALPGSLKECADDDSADSWEAALATKLSKLDISETHASGASKSIDCDRERRPQSRAVPGRPPRATRRRRRTI